MRYEVRTAEGKLIGLYNGPDLQGCIRLLSLPPLKAMVLGDSRLSYAEEQLTIRDVILERMPLFWGLNQSEIPMLVLRSGKRTWLNDVKGFRRI